MPVEEMRRLLELLSKAAHDPQLLTQLTENERVELMRAAGKIARPSPFDRSRLRKAMRRDRRQRDEALDRQARASTEIRCAREAAVFAAPARREAPVEPGPELKTPRHCYVCKIEFRRLHFFYDALCSDCGEFNYAKRFQTVPLEGRAALITGARVKIGYQAALMMLRAGARVIATTRFPRDAALRYAREPDFEHWKDRLSVFGLDLRHSPSVELFARYLDSTEPRLDFLINNAAQTVRRPAGFYGHLLPNEELAFSSLPAGVRGLLRGQEECAAALGGPVATESCADQAALVAWRGGGAGIGLRASARLSQWRYAFDEGEAPAEVFPVGKLDADLQQLDLRRMNTWRMSLASVPSAEMIEVQLINAIAPFILCARLKSLMLRAEGPGKHIVNVSAMEGSFSRGTKTDKHPHTNMAKAALNMLTLTSAPDYRESGIHMNAVDTGWVTDEDPAQHAARKRAALDFQPPLDIVDGAARVCDPFIDGLLTGRHQSGRFFKDYKPVSW